MGRQLHESLQHMYHAKVFGRGFALLEGLAILHEGLAIQHGTLCLTLTLTLTVNVTLTPPALLQGLAIPHGLASQTPHAETPSAE